MKSLSGASNRSTNKVGNKFSVTDRSSAACRNATLSFVRAEIVSSASGGPGQPRLNSVDPRREEMESFFTQRQLPNPRLHLLSQPRSPQIRKDIRQRSLFIERVRVAARCEQFQMIQMTRTIFSSRKDIDFSKHEKIWNEYSLYEASP